jgi:hypothetical protein
MMSWHLPDYKSASENAERKEREELRDHFAMAALTGLISETEAHAWHKIPTVAYELADLMLEARKEKKDG